MSDYVNDNHTLYVKYDCATADQIRACFTEALTNYQKKTRSNIDSRFRVNPVENRDGVPQNHSFVFFMN